MRVRVQGDARSLNAPWCKLYPRNPEQAWRELGLEMEAPLEWAIRQLQRPMVR